MKYIPQMGIIYLIYSNFSPSNFRSTPGDLCEGRMTELVIIEKRYLKGNNNEKFRMVKKNGKWNNWGG